MMLNGMTQAACAPKGVAVAPALAAALEISTSLEVTNDALDGALGNSYLRGDVTHRHQRVALDAHQDVSVVGQEGPVAC